MRFKAEEVIRGISLSEFTNPDTGEIVKSGAVFVDVALDPKFGGKGFRTKMLRCASLEVGKSVHHLAFPLKAELDLEEMATRKTEQMMVVGIRPLQQVKAAAS